MKRKQSKKQLRAVAAFTALTMSLCVSGCSQKASAKINSATNTKEGIAAPVLALSDYGMPTTGDIKALIIIADFQDLHYNDTALDDVQIQDAMFGTGVSESAPCESLSAYYDRASYGALKMSGDVYHYTLKGNIAEYEDKEAGYKKAVTEILEGLDTQIDYTKYDSNQDGYIDALSISVPEGGDAEFWYGCTATWYESEYPNIDGMKLYRYVMSDEQPYQNTIGQFIGTLAHEYGHCMGLPDYYKYDTQDDWQGTHGEAGIERMDEAEGDFCSFSKLMLGWYQRSQIQTAYVSNGAKQEFTLTSDSTDGSCLVIPRYNSTGYLTEYFVVDYVTPEANYDGLFSEGGVRIYHADASVSPDEYYGPFFTYEGYSEYYDKTNQGRRVVRLVNDGNGFYSEGDVVSSAEEGFGWYDKDGKPAIEPEFTINVDSITDGKCKLTVEWTQK